jgi:hypothetical protein
MRMDWPTAAVVFVGLALVGLFHRQRLRGRSDRAAAGTVWVIFAVVTFANSRPFSDAMLSYPAAAGSAHAHLAAQRTDAAAVWSAP